MLHATSPKVREKEARAMATIFITGSSAGIGRETAETLVHMGHRVVLHAGTMPGADAEEAVPGAAAVVVGTWPPWTRRAP